MGKHTPVVALQPAGSDVHRGQCRYCGRPIMRTLATRTWFLATTLASGC